MLNIIHRLKSGMFPALFFLTSASVLAQPLTIPPGHWQEGMAVGVTEFSGTLYVRDASWQWQPRAVRMSAPDAVQAGLTTGKSGMVRESRRGQDFYILGGHTTSLTTARPGLQPSVTLLQVAPSSPRIAARGELARGAGALRGNHVHDAPFSGMAGQYHCRSGLERGQRRGDAGGRKAGETPVMAGERL